MNLEKKDTNSAVVEIIEILNEFNTRDAIIVLSNLFVTLGLLQMDFDASEETTELDTSDILETIKEHKTNHGETLGSALATQGVVMSMWIDKPDNRRSTTSD